MWVSSSLPLIPFAKILIDYAERMRTLNLPLRLLVENEIFRLSVWGNPTSDSRKAADLVGNTERTLLEVSPPLFLPQ